MLDSRWLAINLVRMVAVGLLLGLAACSASDQAVTPTPAASPGPAGITLAKEEITGMQVEMIIFSGRPNPSWPLTLGEQERVHALLAQAAPGDTRPIEGQLGYSGFNLTLQTATGGLELRIYDGAMMAAGSGRVALYRDDRRGLERLLLETSKPHIDPALYQSISDTIPEQ